MLRPRPRSLAAVAALVGAVLAVSGCGSATVRRGASLPTTSIAAPTTAITATSPATVPAGIDATIVRVVDGDTVVARMADGTEERVRLIGIDTPETKDPRRPVECFGREAAGQTAALLPPGTAVRLERDVETRDRYGRLLAYVWRLDDGRFVNAVLVEGGWAVPYRYPPNVRYAELFSALGSDARAANRGLWRACGGADTPASG